MVGSGDLGVEVDIPHLATDIEGAATEYDPSNYHGLYVRFADEGPLITVYRTGKYIITGCSTRASLEATRKEFLQALSDLSMVEDTEDTSFALQNVVCTADLGEGVNLSTLAIALGLENTEYEPEQFPGLVYRPESYLTVLLIFANGKVIITGSPDIESATDAFDHLRSRIDA
jgi:transcription initiation factor TFIID TATA-box-binding protein